MRVIGKRLETLRKSKGITQNEAAELLGVTQTNYGRLEKNDERLNIVVLAKLAEFYEVPLLEIITGDSNIADLRETIKHQNRVIELLEDKIKNLENGK